MYKNKIDNMNNLSGIAIRNLRIEKGWSQRELADALQLLGLDLDKNAIQRIEARKRFVTDIELTYFAKIFEVDYSVLLDSQTECNPPGHSPEEFFTIWLLCHYYDNLCILLSPPFFSLLPGAAYP